MSNNYNEMYEKLVLNDKDFTGMIAYAIYKSEKRETIRNGLDVAAFTALKLQKHEVNKYRNDANQLVTLFLQTAADDKIKSIKKEISKKINKIAVEDLPKDTLGARLLTWHNAGASGIIGNFWTGVIVAVFIWFMADSNAWDSAKDSAVNATKKVYQHAATANSQENKSDSHTQ